MLLRYSTILNIENDEKFCFLWLIIAILHPSTNNHRHRVSNYRQHFDELNIDGFDFTNGFKCIDVHNFEKLNSFSLNMFDLVFCQDQNKWKIKSISIEIS